MSWDNQYTPKKPGEYGWHMDHIIPHSSFNYDSFDHPDFVKCWALENLRPLCAIMNMQKGNKELYQSHYSTFRDGLRKKDICKTGIWKHLEYTNLDAKKYIESRFSDEMNWENHGQFWQLDHINPVAHLAYLDESDTNFKLVWSLSNLMPLEKSENASKSSIFENKFWIHNYADTDYKSKTSL
jgi:5-methylcytosine-specific restriction endonuclease McrA